MTEQHNPHDNTDKPDSEDAVHQLADDLTLILVKAVRGAVTLHGIRVGAPALCLALGRAAGITICAVHEDEPRRILRSMLDLSIEKTIDNFDAVASEKKEASNA